MYMYIICTRFGTHSHISCCSLATGASVGCAGALTTPSGATPSFSTGCLLPPRSPKLIRALDLNITKQVVKAKTYLTQPTPPATIFCPVFPAYSSAVCMCSCVDGVTYGADRGGMSLAVMFLHVSAVTSSSVAALCSPQCGHRLFSSRTT